MRGPPQRHRLDPVDEHRRGRRLARPGQRNADVGVLAFARPVDDAAHHRDVEPLDARIERAPPRHRRRQVVLDVAREFLEHRRGRAAAAGAGGDLRGEDAEPHRLQQLLRDPHLLRPVAARLGGERNADRVAEALLQQHAERGRGGDDPFRPHAGFGQAEMQRIVRALGQHAIDRDQVLHRRHFGRQDDARARKSDLLRARRGNQRGADHRLARDRARVERARRSWRSRPSGRSAVPGRASPSWRRCEPALPLRMAISTIWPNCRSRLFLKPTLPGLMRYLSSASAQAGWSASSLWPM